jgi:three-Cys-motif partner protein
MPVIDSIGQSDYTRLKQDILGVFLNVHTKIVKGITERFGWADNQYLYLDLNAGPGVYGDIEGSPIVFIKTARRNKLKFRAILTEKEIVHCNSLIDRLDCLSEGNIFDIACQMIPYSNVVGSCVGRGDVVVVCNEDNENTIKSMKTFYSEKDVKSPFGLIYMDPNGCQVRFGELKDLLSQSKLSRLDLLINLSASAIKRNRHNDSVKSIMDSISGIKKKHWLIRKPYGKWQWTFLLGTNWVNFPELEKIDFVSMDSEKGRQYINKVNYSAEELSQISPTETTENIFPIHCSQQFALQL